MTRGRRAATDAMGQEGGDKGNTWSGESLISAETFVSIGEVSEHVANEFWVA